MVPMPQYECQWSEPMFNGDVAHDVYDIHTISTLTSNDTVPLSTDLDPFCYNNEWAAKQVKRAMR